MKHGQWIIILAVCGGLASWVLDGVIDHLFFSEKPLADAVLLGISSHDLFMRLVVLVLFITFGLVAYRIFRAQQRAEAEKAEAIPRGEIPSPINPPSGCRFHPRCPKAFDKCEIEEPELRDMGNERQVACHLY